ncbi:hypothetical protein FNV43_RR18553 [Rhamnella rubrinervis]|uniref:Uncharacterized protein n=1 Tax=Rhamnella rubrinervis TaxID=2594499 RepID=A0A8K0E6H3_9ROSA|nr:hypothetical protein FNV43_RR18553 [Rhamnella rubrinervis]
MSTSPKCTCRFVQDRGISLDYHGSHGYQSGPIAAWTVYPNARGSDWGSYVRIPGGGRGQDGGMASHRSWKEEELTHPVPSLEVPSQMSRVCLELARKSTDFVEELSRGSEKAWLGREPATASVVMARTISLARGGKRRGSKRKVHSVVNAGYFPIFHLPNREEPIMTCLKSTLGFQALILMDKIHGGARQKI